MAAKNKGVVRPDGTIRRSQVVTTFGPGSMLDMLNDAVLVGGLDSWRYDNTLDIPYIREPRLQVAIEERLRKLNRELHPQYPFRAAPTRNETENNSRAGIQVLEFPQWFVCQNSSCRALQRKDGLEHKHGHYRHQCSKTQSGECVPVRFVVACKRGHIDEVPWKYFVHAIAQKEPCPSPLFKMHEGASGDFKEIEITCVCGAKASLANAQAGSAFSRCYGKRPWLGKLGDEECSEQTKLLVRTASNSYFSQHMSALSIPNNSEKLVKAITDQWDVLKVANEHTLGVFRQIPMVGSAIGGFSDAEVLEAIRKKADTKPEPAKPIRTEEYQQFINSEWEKPGNLTPEEKDFVAMRITPKDGLPHSVAKLVAVPKLRQVKALIGFTRLEPVTPDVQGEYDLGVETAELALNETWLPATEILGEGIFIELDEKAVKEWEKRKAVQDRAKELLSGYEAWASQQTSAPDFPGVRFYLLHSLSHLLLSAISLECGYAASAISERIYCGPSRRDATPMAGILLSTGTPGSEGTLGGLVEQGRAIRAHLKRAWEMGKLCSNDPVCAMHTPKNDTAERFLEGAACHGCLFIAECSCEWFNRYLDRSLVLPTLGHPNELAFFSKIP